MHELRNLSQHGSSCEGSVMFKVREHVIVRNAYFVILFSIHRPIRTYKYDKYVSIHLKFQVNLGTILYFLTDYNLVE